MAAAAGSRSKLYALGVVVFLAVISVLYYMSAPVYLYIVAYMWFGFLYGALQQYGRFCFASAWRDLIMIKVPRMFVGIMIGLMTLSVISAWLFTKYPNFYHATPLGPHELVGGFLFGLGMVLAGGCATGSLYKTGEGNMISLVVLLSLSFAQAIFVSLPFFDPLMNKFVYMTDSAFKWPQLTLEEKVFSIPAGQHGSFLQNLFANSFINTMLVGIILLVAVYIIVVRKGFLKRRTQEIAATAAADGGEAKMGFKDEAAGFWSMITSSRRTTIAAVLLGIVAAFQVFTMSWMQDKYDFRNFGQVMTGTPGNTEEEIAKNKAEGSPPPASWPKTTYPDDASKKGTMFDPGYWYITTQEAMFAGWAIEDGSGGNIDMKGNNYFGQTNGIPKPWHSPALLLSFGLILGASVLALTNREFKWKFPSRELFVYALVGGTIMGIGSRIALGCNIGAFYTRAAFGNPGGWIFFIGMGLGALISAMFINWWANRKMAKIDFDIEL